jgi:integrase
MPNFGALALTAKSIDLSAKVIVIERLTKRKAGFHRQVPVPPELLDTLDMVHGIRADSHIQLGRPNR